MKRTSILIALLLTITLLVISPIRSATLTSLGQEQDNKQEEVKISGALGEKTNPVRCDGPGGERKYLNRLRCPDGNRPQYSRSGSYGRGPYGHILDGYPVSCGGKEITTIFMDMYHGGYVEKEAVPGFTIVDE